jgi:hypothetical protein
MVSAEHHQKISRVVVYKSAEFRLLKLTAPGRIAHLVNGIILIRIRNLTLYKFCSI